MGLELQRYRCLCMFYILYLSKPAITFELPLIYIAGYVDVLSLVRMR